jgi:hypothetical protein
LSSRYRSTGEFEEALSHCSADAGGFRRRASGAWSDEHVRWSKRYLSAKRYLTLGSQQSPLQASYPPLINTGRNITPATVFNE